MLRFRVRSNRYRCKRWHKRHLRYPCCGYGRCHIPILRTDNKDTTRYILRGKLSPVLCVSYALPCFTRRAPAEGSQMLPGIDTQVVAVLPRKFDGIAADWFCGTQLVSSGQPRVGLWRRVGAKKNRLTRAISTRAGISELSETDRPDVSVIPSHKEPACVKLFDLCWFHSFPTPHRTLRSKNSTRPIFF